MSYGSGLNANKRYNHANMVAIYISKILNIYKIFFGVYLAKVDKLPCIRLPCSR